MITARTFDAYCLTCPWRSRASNASASAGRHARSKRHRVQVTTVTVIDGAPPPDPRQLRLPRT